MCQMSLQDKNYPPFMFEGKWGSQRLELSLVPVHSQWLHKALGHLWLAKTEGCSGRELTKRVLKPNILVLCNSGPRKHSWIYSATTIGTSQYLPTYQGFCAVAIEDQDKVMCFVFSN